VFVTKVIVIVEDLVWDETVAGFPATNAWATSSSLRASSSSIHAASAKAAVPRSGTATSPVHHSRGSQWLAVSPACAAVSRRPSAPVASASTRLRRGLSRILFGSGCLRP
jgi:hypothetical protein